MIGGGRTGNDGAAAHICGFLRDFPRYPTAEYQHQTTIRDLLAEAGTQRLVYSGMATRVLPPDEDLSVPCQCGGMNTTGAAEQTGFFLQSVGQGDDLFGSEATGFCRLTARLGYRTGSHMEGCTFPLHAGDLIAALDQTAEPEPSGDSIFKIPRRAGNNTLMRAIYRDFKVEGTAMFQRFNQKDVKEQAWYYRTIASLTQRLSDTSAWLEYKTLTELVFGKEV